MNFNLSHVLELKFWTSPFYRTNRSDSARLFRLILPLVFFAVCRLSNHFSKIGQKSTKFENRVSFWTTLLHYFTRKWNRQENNHQYHNKIVCNIEFYWFWNTFINIVISIFSTYVSYFYALLCVRENDAFFSISIKHRYSLHASTATAHLIGISNRREEKEKNKCINAIHS